MSVDTTHGVWLGREQKRLRDEHGMTAEQLAEFAACSADAVRRYERGSMPDSLVVAARIAFALGVTVEHLYREVPA